MTGLGGQGFGSATGDGGATGFAAGGGSGLATTGSTGAIGFSGSMGLGLSTGFGGCCGASTFVLGTASAVFVSAVFTSGVTCIGRTGSPTPAVRNSLTSRASFSTLSLLCNSVL